MEHTNNMDIKTLVLLLVDRHADADAADGHRAGHRAAREHTLFVEHAVVGQVALEAQVHASVGHQRRGVVQASVLKDGQRHDESGPARDALGAKRFERDGVPVDASGATFPEGTVGLALGGRVVADKAADRGEKLSIWIFGVDAGLDVARQQRVEDRARIGLELVVGRRQRRPLRARVERLRRGVGARAPRRRGGRVRGVLGRGARRVHRRGCRGGEAEVRAPASGD